jgi:UDP-2,3-diacylglucosamine pyrophosphatase LpxH
MLSFREETSGFSFYNKETLVAVGFYESGNFNLLYEDNLCIFTNAMKAFSYLNDKEFAFSKNIMNSKTQTLLSFIEKRGK